MGIVYPTWIRPESHRRHRHDEVEDDTRKPTQTIAGGQAALQLYFGANLRLDLLKVGFTPRQRVYWVSGIACCLLRHGLLSRTMLGKQSVAGLLATDRLAARGLAGKVAVPQPVKKRKRGRCCGQRMHRQRAWPVGSWPARGQAVPAINASPDGVPACIDSRGQIAHAAKHSVRSLARDSPQLDQFAQDLHRLLHLIETGPFEVGVGIVLPGREIGRGESEFGEA